MKKETNTPPPLHAFAESRIGLEISTEATARLGPKPPWQRLKDRGKKIITIGREIYRSIELIEWVWEHVQPFLGRRCQPASVAQV